MPRATALGRMERLDLLASRLKADEPMSAAGLAAEFAVSQRTLARDIALLRAKGLPVEADRGRGGGTRLNRLWGIGRMALTYREAIDLLVSLAIAEQLQSPWLIANLSSIRRKLGASFSPDLRRRIGALKNRILIGRSASVMVLADFKPPDRNRIAALFQAFLEMRLLRIAYSDMQGRRSERTIEAHYLMLNYPVWYVIAWDQARDAVRSFRCDRIASAALEAEAFGKRPPSEFEAAIAGTGAITP